MMSSIYSLTSSQIKAFHSALERRFGVTFVSDRRGIAAKVVGLLHDRMIKKFDGLIPVDLLEVRPCVYNKYVFLPWEIGATNVTPIRQVLTAAHETLHSSRIAVYPKSVIMWYSEYFFRDTFRAIEESIAQSTTAQIQYWASCDYPRLNLSGYACSNNAIEVAQESYDRMREQIRKSDRGTTLNEVSKFSIETLMRLGCKSE